MEKSNNVANLIRETLTSAQLNGKPGVFFRISGGQTDEKRYARGLACTLEEARDIVDALDEAGRGQEQSQVAQGKSTGLASVVRGTLHRTKNVVAFSDNPNTKDTYQIPTSEMPDVIKVLRSKLDEVKQ